MSDKIVPKVYGLTAHKQLLMLQDLLLGQLLILRDRRGGCEESVRRVRDRRGGCEEGVRRVRDRRGGCEQRVQ